MGRKKRPGRSIVKAVRLRTPEQKAAFREFKKKLNSLKEEV